MDALASLVRALGSVAQTGGILPGERRAEICDCVSELARELDRALTTAIAYLQRAEASDSAKELTSYLRSGASRLDGTYAEVGANRRIAVLVARLDALTQTLPDAQSVWCEPPAEPAIAAAIVTGWSELGVAADDIAAAGGANELRAMRGARARIRSELIALDERKKEVAGAARAILQTM